MPATRKRARPLSPEDRRAEIIAAARPLFYKYGHATTTRLVAEAAADAGGGKRVGWLPDLDAAERFLRAELREGDLLLTLGAGDVTTVGEELLAVHLS